MRHLKFKIRLVTWRSLKDYLLVRAVPITRRGASSRQRAETICLLVWVDPTVRVVISMVAFLRFKDAPFEPKSGHEPNAYICFTCRCGLQCNLGS